MHIYAFGSIVRGEVRNGSDIDLLAIVQGHVPQFDPDVFSIYSYRRIIELWCEGNPFAWHLHLEARLLYSSDCVDFLQELGKPAAYSNCLRDCEKFFALFISACDSIRRESNSIVFDLSTVFLSVRNFASCFSLGQTDCPNFSRGSALTLGRDNVPISELCYKILERARILSTRGYGPNFTKTEVDVAIRELTRIEQWMEILLKEVRRNERIQ